jgi:AraC-like DNA-binding protein
VADALRTIARFAALRTPALSVSLQMQSDGGAALGVQPALDLGAANHFVLEAFAVSVARLLVALTGNRLAQVEYRLPWACPPWAARYAEVLGGEVRFGATALSMRYPREVLQLRCLTADPEAYQSAQRALERGIAIAHGDGALPQRVRALLEHSVPRYPSSAEVARQLNLSVRTLYRQLREQGIRFQTLVDAIRLEEAQWRLLHTDESVERIAEHLGFIDTSNFARAFKRWTNSTPRAYRSDAKRLA